MTPEVLQAKQRNLTGIARKVLDAVPMQEPWGVPQILNEIARTTGSKPEHRIVVGCLRSLRDDGLIREIAPHEYQRAHSRQSIKDKGAAVANDPSKGELVMFHGAEPAPPPPPLDALQRLAALAEDARELARALDEAALEVSAQIEQLQKDTAKLHQLHELLKGI